METKTELTLTKQRGIALDLISRLVEEAIESGNIPQPSAFGVHGHDEDESDPVYDWCQELIEAMVDEVHGKQEDN